MELKWPGGRTREAARVTAAEEVTAWRKGSRAVRVAASDGGAGGQLSSHVVNLSGMVRGSVIDVWGGTAGLLSGSCWGLAAAFFHYIICGKGNETPGTRSGGDALAALPEMIGLGRKERACFALSMN